MFIFMFLTPNNILWWFTVLCMRGTKQPEIYETQHSVTDFTVVFKHITTKQVYKVSVYYPKDIVNWFN